MSDSLTQQWAVVLAMEIFCSKTLQLPCEIKETISFKKWPWFYWMVFFFLRQLSNLSEVQLWQGCIVLCIFPTFPNFLRPTLWLLQSGKKSVPSHKWTKLKWPLTLNMSRSTHVSNRWIWGLIWGDENVLELKRVGGLPQIATGLNATELSTLQ